MSAQGSRKHVSQLPSLDRLGNATPPLQASSFWSNNKLKTRVLQLVENLRARSAHRTTLKSSQKGSKERRYRATRREIYNDGEVTRTFNEGWHSNEVDRRKVSFPVASELPH
jgi:hypothetical protein